MAKIFDLLNKQTENISSFKIPYATKKEAQTAGWIFSKKDMPILPGESDCDHWQRIYNAMPEEQKNHITGGLAQIGTQKLQPEKYLITKEFWNEIKQIDKDN